MKLTSLLLSSAALLVAGSAFAADLPAKKAAPAAAVVACPAFGAGFFQLPGSDTCIQLSGYVNYVASYNTQETSSTIAARYAQGGNYRLNLDARSNTEIGVVRGYSRLNNGALGKAYVQFSGVTAGMKDSLADIAGTYADNYGSGWSQSASGIDYSMAAGPVTLAIGVENSNNNNVGATAATQTYVSDRPDLIARVTFSAGPVGVKVAAVSHEALDSVAGVTKAQGSAILGQLTAAAGPVNLILFGGTSTAAGKYTGSPAALDDYVGTLKLKGTSMGAEINTQVGSAGVIAIAGHRNTHKGITTATDQTDTSYSLFYQHTVAKSLTIRPEYLVTQSKIGTAATTTSSTVYLRIQRDF